MSSVLFTHEGCGRTSQLSFYGKGSAGNWEEENLCESCSAEGTLLFFFLLSEMCECLVESEKE